MEYLSKRTVSHLITLSSLLNKKSIDEVSDHECFYRANYINKIDDIITLVKKSLGEKNINIAEGFSGSGIVSRLFKNRVMSDTTLPLKNFYVNDIAGYFNGGGHMNAAGGISDVSVEETIEKLKDIFNQYKPQLINTKL